MFRSLTFAAQLLGLSALLSLAVKYGAPHLPDPPSTVPILALMIALPTLAVAGLLTWRQIRSEPTPFETKDQALGDVEEPDQEL